MKKLLLPIIGVACLSALPAKAQFTVDPIVSQDVVVANLKMSDGGKILTELTIPEVSPEKLRARTKALENAERHILSIVSDRVDGVRLQCLTALLENTDVFWNDFRDQCEFQVPTGKYLIQATYCADDGMIMNVFVPDVMVDKDVEIHVTPESATHTAAFEFLLPNGELAQFPSLDENGEVIEGTGNVGGVLSCVMETSYKGVSKYVQQVYVDQSVSPEAFLRALVQSSNIDSKDVCYKWMICAESNGQDKTIYTTYFTVAGDKIKEGEVFRNVINDYIKFNPVIDHTPAYATMGDGNSYRSFNLMTNSKGYNNFGIGVNAPEQFTTFICVSEQEWIDENVYATMSNADAEIQKKYGIMRYGNDTPPCVYTPSGWKALSDERGELIMSDGEVISPSISFNPYFSFIFDEDYHFCVSGSVCSVEKVGIEAEVPYSYYITRYFGNGSETRPIDDYVKTSNVQYNGEQVYSSEIGDPIYKWAGQWAQENHPKGKMTYRFNSENVEIDGIKGGNYCEVSYDESLADCDAPTVKRVMISDQEGRPVIKFNSAAEGRIAICGGDFVKQTIAVPGWEGNFNPVDYYTCSSASLVARVAPHGTDLFEEIKMTEDPEKSRIPLFGTYWSATLEGVKAQGTTGWFDLELTITDESGNYQKQVISPAFYIDPESGIEEVEANTDMFEVTGDDILLPYGGKVYDCTGRLQNPSGLSSGVYIVIIGSESSKVIIR